MTADQLSPKSILEMKEEWKQRNEEKFPKGPEETSVSDGYIHYLEMSDDFNLYTQVKMY